MKKAQSGTAVKKTVSPKVKSAPKKIKKVPEEWKYSNDPYNTNVSPSSKTGMAQMGKNIKKTTPSKPKINMAVPGMNLPKTFPKKVETATAKSGTKMKKYQMGGFVSNEFAAKSIPKTKPKPKMIDSPIKSKKDIYAYQGKKGMLAKSGVKLNNKK